MRRGWRALTMPAAIFNLSQRFPRRRAFITGAASGLGLACAELLAREGWELFLTDVDEPRLGLVAQSLQGEGAMVAAAACDVRDAAALEALVAQAVEVVGGIDVSLHAAGVATAGGFLASPVDDWRWVFDVNVLGTVHSCRAVLPQMQAQRSGLVINIASAAGFATNAKIASYNSAKAAVIALSEALMQGFAQFDIQVVAAMPGFFRTRLLDAARGRTHFVYPSRYQWLWRLKRLSPGRFQTWLPRLLSR